MQRAFSFETVIQKDMALYLNSLGEREKTSFVAVCTFFCPNEAFFVVFCRTSSNKSRKFYADRPHSSRTQHIRFSHEGVETREDGHDRGRLSRHTICKYFQKKAATPQPNNQKNEKQQRYYEA